MKDCGIGDIFLALLVAVMFLKRGYVLVDLRQSPYGGARGQILQWNHMYVCMLA